MPVVGGILESGGRAAGQPAAYRYPALGRPAVEVAGEPAQTPHVARRALADRSRIVGRHRAEEGQVAFRTQVGHETVAVEVDVPELHQQRNGSLARDHVGPADRYTDIVEG